MLAAVADNLISYHFTERRKNAVTVGWVTQSCDFLDPSGLHSQTAMTARRNFLVVRHKNQRRLPLCVDGKHQFDNLVARRGVKVARGFIGQNQFRLRCEGPCQGNPLLLAARKMFRIMAQPV